MLRWISLVVVAGALAFTPCTSAQLSEEMIRENSSKESHVLFYGKVVDQYSRPVSGAEIIVAVSQANLKRPFKEHPVSTREDGTFSVDAGKGGVLKVTKIEKPGYVYEFYEGMPALFNYLKGSKRHIPDESNPVVFMMRRKEAEPTYLFHHIWTVLQFSAANDFHAGFDVVREVVDPNRYWLEKYLDIEANAHWKPGDATCEITLKANGDDAAGLILSDQFLGMAPESGYQKSLTLIFEDRKPVQQKYLYVRSRTPAIYSRFEIGGAGMGRDWLQLGLQGHTNPYGERNLEMDEQFPIAARHHIQAKVREAYRDGVPLDVAPLKELIEVARGTTEAESHRIADQVDDLVKKVEREERRNFEIDTATLTEMYRKAKKVKN